MVSIKYTENQINDLRKNKYVKSCTNKNINFTQECKIKVLKLSNSWMFIKEIFEKLWFPKYIINSDIPSSSLKRWKNNQKKWNIEFKKWRPRIEKIDFDNMTLEQENEYLRTKLALYEELADYMNSWLP